MQLCLPLHILYLTTNVSSDTLIASDTRFHVEMTIKSFTTILFAIRHTLTELRVFVLICTKTSWENINWREDLRTLFPMRIKHTLMSHILLQRLFAWAILTWNNVWCILFPQYMSFCVENNTSSIVAGCIVPSIDFWYLIYTRNHIHVFWMYTQLWLDFMCRSW